MTLRIISAAAAALALVALAARSQTPADNVSGGMPPVSMAGEAVAADSLSVADSVALAPPTLADIAAEKYHEYKLVQYDGEAEEMLYERVLGVVNSAMLALDDTETTPDDVSRIKGILLDTYPMLRRAAAFHSSAGNGAEAIQMASACVNVHMLPQMRGEVLREDAAMYSTMVYMAASGAYNTRNYEGALRYFDEYLRTGVTDRREDVLSFMGQASLAVSDYSRAPQIAEATADYPANVQMLMVALQLCLDGGYTDQLASLLDKALALRPDDEQLLNVQARLLEEQGNYSQALSLWLRLSEIRPNNLGVTKHLALTYYNLGADYYNRAIMESDQKAQKKYQRQSSAYFQSAVRPLQDVVANDPADVKSLRALAITYGCLGDAAQLDQVNASLQALGQKPMAINSMPESITFGDAAEARPQASAPQREVPDFQQFAQSYVESRLAEWTRRGEFEKMTDYEARINPSAVNGRYRELCREAEAEYIKRYASRLRISDLELHPYDADNETYLITSSYGPITVKVPLKGQEAEAFKSGWSSIQLNNPRFFISDNHVAIASVELVTGYGKRYTFDSEKAANYDYTDVTLDLDSFIEKRPSGSDRMADNGGGGKVIRAKSDVDVNIPVTSRRAERTLAVVMGNENYKRVAKVESALNDAETFAEYCTKTLGIPAEQVMLYSDQTYAEMLSAVSRLKPLVRSMGSDVDVIFYYAGHGVPDEATKDAYLLPCDADGLTTAASYPLEKLYSELEATGAGNVMVFLDACFSGMNREGEPLHAARAVAFKPRAPQPTGSMFVLSAASGQETAMPYREKNHGLFTYFLLKKLQDSKGNVTLDELSRYVTEQVGRESVLINKKPQTPVTTVTGALRDNVARKKLRP